MTEQERKDTQIALLYELRLALTQGEKTEYTLQELTELIDKMALTKK